MLTTLFWPFTALVYVSKSKNLLLQVGHFVEVVASHWLVVSMRKADSTE